MLPVRSPRFRSARPLGLAALLALPLIGCVQSTGDFGRARPGFTQNALLPYTGLLAAGYREEPASSYALTEDEKEMRNRAWNFLMPEPDAPRGAWQERHMAFHRLLPPREHDVTLFHRTIMGGPFLGTYVGDSPVVRRHANWGDSFASLVSRYNRVKDRIAQDHALMPQFRQVAAQVTQADHVRLRSLDSVGNLTAEQRTEAMARICENALIIARVNWAFHDKAAQYRYSLEHLLVEGPEREAIPSERVLMAFEADIGRFTKGTLLPDACKAEMPPVMTPRPLVRKG